jgi:hypothetical protein
VLKNTYSRDIASDELDNNRAIASQITRNATVRRARVERIAKALTT